MGLSQADIDSVLSGSGTEPSGVATEPAPSPESTPASIAVRAPDVSRILGLEVALSVILAARDMTVDSILETTAGTIIEFEVPFDAELSLNIGSRTIGLGQTVKIGENFGLRITSLVGQSDRARAMGG